MFYDCPVDISYQKLIKGTEEKLNNFIIEILEKKKKTEKEWWKAMDACTMTVPGIFSRVWGPFEFSS